MLVLGINCAYHESAACLLYNGRVVAAVEEERFNRRKRAKASLVTNADELPLHAVSHCFEAASKLLGKNVDWSSIDHV
ncbi:MAG: carbamoyltransferase, partial [Gemmatimonadetes bacterium]|nr:carbamoyltransferase [Gemmatimonadota bacterium]